MSNPVAPVSGYRPLSDQQIALMNENKLLEELVMRQIDRHKTDPDALQIDQRMVALANTAIQDAFMWLNRSIAQPQRIRPATPDLEAFENRAEVLLEKLLK